MVVRIRLKRLGKPKTPHYRLVAIDKRARRDGAPIEVLGTYSPLPKEAAINLNMERIDYWLSKGAQPSKTAASIIKKSLKSSAKVQDTSI
jgi:small subunit ribosomal protein S16